MIQPQITKFLQNKKNLLAFSAGGDSTALFFLLLEHNIPFDIAIVDYNLREQSKAEVAYAKELAKKYQKECYVKNSPKIKNNFEANARKIRYDFFSHLIEQNGYETLLTAHHLGDRLEWFLMQFTKGAGSVELVGMKQIEQKESYTLVRPLLDLTKEELLEYLKLHKITFFEDETNQDQNYKRNYFRHNFAKPLLQEYAKGIAKSFEYLEKDVNLLVEDIEVHTFGDMAFFYTTSNKRAQIVALDRYFKKIGHLLTKNERTLLETKQEVVISRRYIVAFFEDFICITPFVQNITLSKEFKEECRVLKINPKQRAFFFLNKKSFEFYKNLNKKKV